MINQEKAELQALFPQTWDKPTAQAHIGDLFHIPHIAFMQVMDKDILPDGQVRLLVKPNSGGATEEWIVKLEPVVEPTAPTTTQLEAIPIEQPSGLSFPSCKLQPAWLAQQEYERGTWWGKHDASARREPLYTEARCPHSTGYLDAYRSFTIANQKLQQPETKKPIEWRVVYAPDWDWDWYKTWVGGECIGQYCSIEEAASSCS